MCVGLGGEGVRGRWRGYFSIMLEVGGSVLYGREVLYFVFCVVVNNLAN